MARGKNPKPLNANWEVNLRGQHKGDGDKRKSSTNLRSNGAAYRKESEDKVSLMVKLRNKKTKSNSIYKWPTKAPSVQ